MIVFVEGVDGSGKTTLCEKLESYVDGSFDVPRYTMNQFDLWKNLKAVASGEIVISDRCFISDLVYRLQDDKERDDLSLLEMCEILKDDVKIIYCETDSSFEDSIARGEDNILRKSQSNKIKKIYSIIMTMFRKFVGVPILKYNWKTDDFENVLKFIKED